MSSSARQFPSLYLLGYFSFPYHLDSREILFICIADHCLLIILIHSLFTHAKSFPVHPHLNHQHTIPITVQVCLIDGFLLILIMRPMKHKEKEDGKEKPQVLMLVIILVVVVTMLLMLKRSL